MGAAGRFLKIDEASRGVELVKGWADIMSSGQRWKGFGMSFSDGAETANDDAVFSAEVENAVLDRGRQRTLWYRGSKTAILCLVPALGLNTTLIVLAARRDVASCLDRTTRFFVGWSIQPEVFHRRGVGRISFKPPTRHSEDLRGAVGALSLFGHKLKR